VYVSQESMMVTLDMNPDELSQQLYSHSEGYRGEKATSLKS